MRWFMRLIRRERLERELDREIEFHVEAEIARLVEEGMTPLEARRRALAAFGGLEPIRERARDARGTRWVEQIWQDLRYAARVLRRSPGFALAAIASLAIGIGANIALFTVADALLLRPLPVDRPEQLVSLNRVGGGELFSHPAFLKFQRAVPIARFTAGSSTARTQISIGGQTELVIGQLVTGDWFDVLGVQAAAGRVLTVGDTRELGGTAIVVLSHEFWRRRFASDPAVIGTTVVVNKVPMTIAGVAAPGFSGLSVGNRVDLWLPVTMQAEVRYYTNSWTENADPRKPWLPQEGIAFLNVLARLPDEASRAAAPAQMAQVHQQSVEAQAKALLDPAQRDQRLRERLELVPAWRGNSLVRESYTEPLRVLMITTALVLLIGCANLASLVLARGSARAREFSLRLALGAGRGRIVRQLLTESLLLATVGGAVAIVVARWAASGLLRLASSTATPIPLDLPFDGRIMLFALAISVLTGVAFGLMPALQLSRAGATDGLKTGGRVTSASGRDVRVPFGRVLIVAQVTLALTLLVGAVAFVRTFNNLLTLHTGFEREHVVAARFEPRLAGFGKEQWPALAERLLSEARGVPGVRSASIAVNGALTGATRLSGGIVVEGQPSRVGPEWSLREEMIGLDYFETLGIPVLRGRAFRSTDVDGAPKVAVISEAMAKRFFGDVDPLGKRFGYGTPPEVEVVGIVRDAKVDGPRRVVPNIAYYPLLQNPDDLANNLYVRVSTSPEAVKPTLLAALSRAEPSLAIREVVTLAELTGRTVTRERLMSQLTSAFGLLAVAVAALGLYATISYSVARRTNELGVRLALGASPASVRWLVLRETLLVVGAGCVTGLILSVVALRYVGTLLFGLTPNDPTTLAAATVTLLTISLLAAIIPAVRAARTDPIRALRAE
ncbi:MAG TPA: ABC transporter permease [Vicinamibacterales bacterium]|nr:ABC transporter permease [Vicinamibacterales bacterium]